MLVFYYIMKPYFFILLIILMTSCKNKETQKEKETKVPEVASLENGEALFQQNNCASCHQPDQKIIGPSLQVIAKIYKAKKGSIVLFLQEKSDPIVDPSQYEIMKTNFAITKTMSDEELKALEDYIYCFSK